ncbi:ArnT family glycosyltransferase [Marinobacter sediminum]|uniref:ArnT family glycosyltransferase n=1 Tax=Marinobacter sediminum TaxID=256323 RepID=UPI00203004E0|nr:glycosyltransferase family 39 protein [Marinobacter sediminum]
MGSMSVSRLLDDLADRISRLSERQLFLLLMAFAAFMIFMGIGLRSPWPADEPRFAEVAREMVDSGQWLIPMRGSEYYPDKPPVFMWAVALFYWLTGNLKIAFLLPNALCGLLTSALVFDLGRRLWNPRTGAIALGLLLLAPQFLIQAKRAQIDGMVACWITVACYGLLRHFFERPAWGWYFAAWGFMGLGIITKGVGFLPIFMFLPLLAMAIKDRTRFGDALTWRCTLGPLVMLLVAAAWLVPMVMYVDSVGTDAALAYRDNILFKQTGERYANSWGHLQPWYYFIVNVIPSLWFPLPLLILAAWRPFARRLRHQPELVVLFVWVILVVVFFSLSPGKRGVYLLPALPMFALGIAVVLDSLPGLREGTSAWLSPLMTGLHGVLAVALIAVGILALNDHPRLVEKFSDYSRDPARLPEAGSFFLTFGILWLASLLIFWRSHALFRWFLALMVSWLLFSTWGYSIMEPLRTPRNILAAAEQRLPPDAELGLLRFSEQFILFSRLDITHFSYFSSERGMERNAWRWMNEGTERYLLVENGLELACFGYEGAPKLGVAHREAWYLLGPDQQKASCQAPAKRQEFTTPYPCRESTGLCVKASSPDL